MLLVGIGASDQRLADRSLFDCLLKDSHDF
jgi:hypothetical protein